jgi:hypothetical protein
MQLAREKSPTVEGKVVGREEDLSVSWVRVALGDVDRLLILN